VMKSTLFLGAGSAIAATGERQWQNMGGLLQRSPLLAGAVFVAFLSLAGIPPLAGFAGKLAIFSALVVERAWAPLLCLLGASAIMLYVAVRVWLGMFGGEAAQQHEMPRARVRLTAAMAAMTVLVGVASGPLFEAAQVAARDLFAGTAYRAAVLGPTPEVIR